MARNLVICLDGTGAQPRARGDSNVIKVFGMLDLTDPTKQIAYYDPGVGTFSSSASWGPLARWLSRVGGLAFGNGLRQNLGEAYTWLMREWNPGDRIFVFGFSRGAYTARALSGMLRTIGLLHAGSENLVPYAVSEFTKRSKDDRPQGQDGVTTPSGKTPTSAAPRTPQTVASRAFWAGIDEFSENFARKVNGRSTVRVAYLGAFDTVKAAGFLKWDIKWPYTRKLDNDVRVRHAVSIDEKRRPFREYLVTPSPQSQLEEVWFAGVHTDVGGTFEDDPRLSNVTLKWIVEGALEEGMLVEPGPYAKACTVTELSADGTVHANSWMWKIFIDRTRPIPANAFIHSSVRPRMEAPGLYETRIPSGVQWADPNWIDLAPVPVRAANPIESAPAPTEHPAPVAVATRPTTP
ncbi:MULTISPECIES: DUF2235 domain-containing protein [unclassified Cryobacterium]|uniref:T6SS phospholipase effector Tle1-like catalytic domain-containing protein n=1 Tax=unclassified Cryobacterium TaxID=2649013 RepID=UPI002AB54962|nr:MULTISPECIES: DUF2235 domain-containing protein [unclassified Cryobacterium]MDY7527858.1 DUF2235 domain-containing protein [Cryobacterium sp. 10C2]MDY7556375.1 DUF2235 domain-containing protein [Cryobacterium sp. 10C3]MEB0001420.1 DUF2235 domain-containing protein [Cryobacterium sp. RTC2.1]MEB0202212.1 DUF2235 domain-containing protein [Cryobacterium sp. 5I3]MEB0289635.1 DUF2235 domain-containing protein [Cryobacterium sp. 10C2]